MPETTVKVRENTKETHFSKFVFVEIVWSLTDVFPTHLFALIILDAKKNEAKTKLKTITLTTESIFIITATKLSGNVGLGQ